MSRVLWVISAIILVQLWCPTPLWASSGYTRQAHHCRVIADLALWYQRDTGRYPETDASGTWFEKLLHGGHGWYLRDFQTISTPQGVIPVDYNGRPLIYELPNPSIGAEPFVRSVGDNGIDDHGWVDDLGSRGDRGPEIGYAWKRAWPRAHWRLGISIALAFVGTAAILWKNWNIPIVLWIGTVLAIGVESRYDSSPDHFSRLPQEYAFSAIEAMGGILLLIGFVKLWYSGFTIRLRRTRNQCLACGYDLRGLPREAITCPECGSLIASTPPAT